MIDTKGALDLKDLNSRKMADKETERLDLENSQVFDKFIGTTVRIPRGDNFSLEL